MRRWLVSLILGCFCLGVPAASPPNKYAPARPAPDGERYLFIVDTSGSMEYLKSEIETAIYEMIGSGIGGQMRVGDTYGLWMFNKQTYAGKFPMKVWEARKSTQLGTIAAAFLDQQFFEKSSNTKQMIAVLTGVVRSVSNLTVFILVDGDSPMRGTPFDKSINEEYKLKRRERAQAKVPFVTTLVVRDGWFVRASVTVAGQPILLPARAPALIAQTRPIAPAPTNQAPVQTTTTSTRPTLPAPSAPGSPSAPAQEVQPTAETTQARTAVASQIPAPVPPVEVSAKSQPTALAAEPARTPRPRVIQISTKTNSAVPTTAKAETTATPSAASPTAIQSNTPGVDAPIARTTLATPAAASPASTPSTTSPLSATSTTLTTSTSKTTPPAAERPVPVSVPDSARAFSSDAPIPVAARELNPESDPAKPAQSPTLRVMGVAAQPGLSAGVLLAFGGVLLAAAAFLALVAMRRGRPGLHGSLITQSMDRR